MKKIFFTAIAVLVMAFSQAQDITDAVRYSSEDILGTARYRAMSGAFGALGGDLSALQVNPAGSAVFMNSFSTFTLNYDFRKNDAQYFNGLTSNRDSNFNFDQAGAVYVFNNKNEGAAWRKFSFGINYGSTKNFEDEFYAKGTGNTSIDKYFLNYANGVPLQLLQTMDGESIGELYSFLGENEGFAAQQAFLGYQGFVIEAEADDAANTNYFSLVSPGNFDQEYSFASTGLNGKFTFNFATQLQDVLYLGANLNAHFLNYDRSTELFEANSNTGSETNEIVFRNNLSTTGNGFSFQLGAIGKVTDNFRLGAAYESPTWYSISEQTSQSLSTYSDLLDAGDIINPNIINIYPDYTLKTPGKITGSLAVLFGGTGLISFDYSYKDYSKIELRPTSDPEFTAPNAEISNNLDAVSAYKVGAEYRIKQFSLRGGYHYEDSPYKNGSTIGDVSGFSLGLGFDFGNFKLDAAYDNSSRTDNPQLYQVGLVNSANLNRDFSSVVLSISFGI